MRVLFDAHQLGSRQGGNETYVRELLRVFATRSNVNIIAAVEDENALATVSDRVKPLRVSRNAVKRMLRLGAMATAEGADVVHSIYYYPYRTRVPAIVTIHDISFESFPQLFPRSLVARNRLLVRHAARSAALVVTVSETERSAICSTYGLDENRVVSIPNGVSPAFNANDASPPRDRTPVRILAVGSLQPRKNFLRLVDAVTRAAATIPISLSIVGPDGPRAMTLRPHLTRYVNVELRGYVSDHELLAAYRDADIFVYPSLYEGFGLPVLEAMASGTPVITSARGALLEVAGDAALLVDPLSSDEIASAILTLAGDVALRRTLVRRGLVRAAAFTWERAADALFEAYERVAGQ